MASKKKSYIDKQVLPVKVKSPHEVGSNPLKYRYGTYQFDFQDYAKRPYKEIVHWFNDHLFDLIKRKGSPSTADTRGRGARKFFEYLEHLINIKAPVQRVSDIASKHLDGFFEWLQEQDHYLKAGAKLNLSTVYKIYIGVSFTLNWARLQLKLDGEIGSKKLNGIGKVLKTNTHVDLQSQPYESRVYKALLNALGQEIQDIRTGKSRLTEAEQLTAYFYLLAARTGLNTQPLLDVSRTAISPHSLDNTKEVLITQKNRSYTSIHSVYKKAKPDDADTRISVSLTIGKLYRELLERTEPLAIKAKKGKLLDQVGEPIHDYLFLLNGLKNSDSVDVRRMSFKQVPTAMKKIVELHGLKDIDGKALSVGTRRLRLNFVESVLKNTGGDIVAASLALGNTPKVLEANYLAVTDDMLKGFSFAGNTIVEKYSTTKDMKALTKTLGVSLATAEKLIDGSYKTGVSRCSDPHYGKFSKNRADEPCLNWTQCFRCPNQVIFMDDLHRLYSFYWLLIKEKELIRDSQWSEVYGWVIREIDDEIAPKFKKSDIQKAKAEAMINPHPLWRSRSELLKGFHEPE